MARVGSIILALAFIAAFRLWRNRAVRFFIALAVVALLAACGAPPVATLLRKIPLFDIAKNERLGFAAAFALSMLPAGYPTPDRVLNKLPQILRGAYDMQGLMRMMGAALLSWWATHSARDVGP